MRRSEAGRGRRRDRRPCVAGRVSGGAAGGRVVMVGGPAETTVELDVGEVLGAGGGPLGPVAEAVHRRRRRRRPRGVVRRPMRGARGAPPVGARVELADAVVERRHAAGPGAGDVGGRRQVRCAGARRHVEQDRTRLERRQHRTTTTPAPPHSVCQASFTAHGLNWTGNIYI